MSHPPQCKYACDWSSICQHEEPWVEPHRVTVNEDQLKLVLDWAASKFPVKSEWVTWLGTEYLLIYLPGHTDHQGMIQIIPGKLDWTVVVDVEFKQELDDVIAYI